MSPWSFLVILAFAIIGTPRTLAPVTADFRGGGRAPLSFTLPSITFVVPNAAMLNGGQLGVLKLDVNNTPA